MNDDPKRTGSSVNKPFRFGLVLMLLIAAWLAWTMFTDRLLPEGTDAPPWELGLAAPAGAQLALADLTGEVVVLDFWSTTCPPCLRQMEDLKLLWRRMKPRGVTVIGISTGGESPSQIARFGADRDVGYPLAIDRGPVAAAYRVSSLPTLYVVGRDGRVAASHSGYWPLEDIASAVAAALDDQPSIQNSQAQK